MTVLNLFRGQCIGASVDQVSTDMLITLDLEDYNRLPPITAIGAPAGDTPLTQADGTVIQLDGRGTQNIAAVFDTFAGGGCWPDTSPALDLVTGFLAPDIPGSPPWDETTALTDLKAYADSLAPRVSGALRWWIAPPLTGDGLVLYWVDYLDPVQVALLPAPYEIDNDAPNWVTSLLPIRLGPISWDWAGIRGSTYIRGGTPAPEGSGFATGLGNSPTGTAYIDAPGSLTDADKTAIGVWHQNRTLVELLTGSATMPGSRGTVTYGGWRVGQTALVTSAVHSRLIGRELDARAAVIQKVTGRLVTPAGGLAITIGGVALTKPFEWKTLTFEQILGSPGKATVVIHLLGSTDTLDIDEDADVWITLDDTDPADIEWDLELGDIPAGSLSRELAKPQPEFVPPVYRFNVEEADPDGVKIGLAELVSAQLSTGPASPIALAGVPMEWVLLQWEDDAETMPGALLVLTDDVGTTDAGGRVFNTLTPSGVLPASYTWEVRAVALPVV